MNATRMADRAADNAWVKIISRISLPILVFVGMQAWNDVKDQSRDISQVLRNQAVTDTKLEDALRRINRLEDSQARKANFQEAGKGLEIRRDSN